MSPGINSARGDRDRGEQYGNAGAVGTIVDKDGKVLNVTYAVSIYPYIADRQDEFDVAV